MTIDPSQIPPWAVGLLLVLFTTSVWFLIRREFSRWDKFFEDMPKILQNHGERLTRLEARDNLAEEIKEAFLRHKA